jgi:hypothetical protein
LVERHEKLLHSSSPSCNERGEEDWLELSNSSLLWDGF